MFGFNLGKYKYFSPIEPVGCDSETQLQVGTVKL